MNNYFNKKDIYKLPFFILSLTLAELGIACYYTARLGTDPISVFVEGVSFHVDLTVGEISTICNIILLIMTFFLYRELIGIGTVLSTLLGGPLIDLFYGSLLKVFPTDMVLMSTRIIIIIAALIIYPIGLGGMIICDLGIGPFSFPPLYLTKKTNIDIKYTQIITDATFFVIGVLLGGVYGMGTIVSVFLTGPMMEMFMKLLDPLLKKMEPDDD
ncbi:MAG: YitT family protein [Erysipelotrichaceae bacterium]|nr:YitT family protein [Erysipelotrichaceae bacterium]